MQIKHTHTRTRFSENKTKKTYKERDIKSEKRNKQRGTLRGVVANVQDIVVNKSKLYLYNLPWD